MERLETTGPVFGGGRSSVLTVIFSPTFCSGSVAGSNAAMTVAAAGGWERCASAGANKPAADWTVSVVMRTGKYFISNSWGGISVTPTMSAAVLRHVRI